MKNNIYRLLLLSLAVAVVMNFTTFGQGVSDPTSIPVYMTSGPITVDGVLDETDWSANVPHLMYEWGGSPSGNSNTPTDGAIVKPPYNDVSTCYVKFLRDATNLYISLNSNDTQVCSFGDSWEGDGIFMKIKDASATDREYKLYYNFHTYDPPIHYEPYSGAVGEGAGQKGPGTIVNDSTNVDGGYTAEMRIPLDSLGFDATTTSVQVLINIFDPDNYSDGVTAWGDNGNYEKQWWGSEWGPDMRTLELSDQIVPVELTSFTAAFNGTDIVLNWSTATETNNQGFEIQRSQNNIDFHSIAFVDGHGTTTEKSTYSYEDHSVEAGVSYSYRLKQIDFDGSFAYSAVVNVDAIAPSEFALNQNYPNPFNPSTNISFNLPVKSNVSLDVYNLLGQRVLTVAQGEFEAGKHQITLDASKLSSGIYIYSLSASGDNGQRFVQSRKMTLLK